MPWTVAIMYLGEPPVDRHGLAIRAGGHVTASQNAGQDIRCRLELGAEDVGESAFAGFDDGAGVVATSRHSMTSAWWASRRYRAPSSWCRPVVAGPGA